MVKKEKKLSAVLTLRTRIRVSPPGSYPALPSKAKVSTGLLDSGPGSGPSGSACTRRTEESMHPTGVRGPRRWFIALETWKWPSRTFESGRDVTDPRHHAGPQNCLTNAQNFENNRFNHRFMRRLVMEY